MSTAALIAPGTLNSKDYYFNHSGQTLNIPSTSNAVFCLFVEGGGRDGEGYCVYDLYQARKEKLIKVGSASEYVGKCECSCRFTLNSVETRLDGFVVDQIFRKIFKR